MPTPGLHSDEARQAVAMIYLNQAGDEVPFPGGRNLDDLPSWERGKEYARLRNLARDEWLKQRASETPDFPEPDPAYMFHIGSGYVKLTVAVFCSNVMPAHAEQECYRIMEEWIQEHRPDELNDEGELDEVYCEIIPAEVEPPDPNG